MARLRRPRPPGDCEAVQRDLERAVEGISSGDSRTTRSGAASPIHPFQAVMRIASPPPSRSICAPKQFAETGSSTPNASLWTGRTQTSTLQATRPLGLSVTQHTPAPSSGPSYGRQWSTKLAATLRSIAEDSGPVSPVDEDRLHFLQHSNG